jgi:hypothetical protein
MSKFDSLRPISAYLERLLVDHGSERSKADLTVFDITDRLVTAGYSWDKALMCHAKGKEKFCKRLIPHVFMSKDDFPPTITPDAILDKVFDFIEDWKQRLFDLLSGKAAIIQVRPSLPSGSYMLLARKHRSLLPKSPWPESKMLKRMNIAKRRLSIIIPRKVAIRSLTRLMTPQQPPEAGKMTMQRTAAPLPHRRRR